MGIAVNEITVKMNAECDQQAERNGELYYIPPDVFRFQKSGPGIEIVKVSDKHSKHQLHSGRGKQLSPFKATRTLKHRNLV